MKKLFKNADLAIYRSAHKVGNHFWVAPEESREVANATNDVALRLYVHYKMLINPDASDINDDVVAKALDWDVKKVQKYRLELIKAGLILFAGSKDYRVLVIGKEQVTLYLERKDM